MNVLIAIVSCHKYRDRVEAIRSTWLPLVEQTGFDYRVFVGEGDPVSEPDVVVLPVDDGYHGLPEKTRAVAQWAIANGYKWVFKCDDDVYLQPTRLRDSDFAQLGQYVGRKRGPSGGHRAPYASGFSYWMGPKALKIIAAATLTHDIAEDRWVGNTLLDAGVQCSPDYRYVVIDSTRNAVSHTEGPREGNSVISACEFSTDRMKGVHREWLTEKSIASHRRGTDGHMLGRLSILVKTFLRDGYLMRTVKGIQEHVPESKIVVVDDGYETSTKISWYAQLRADGHDCLWLPFDSGFGAKANEGVKSCTREYVLVASDDFHFTAETRSSLIRMVNFLDLAKNFDVVSGRVNNRPYEATLDIQGDRVVESSGYNGEGSIAGINFKDCDLTVNFSVIRRSLLDRVKWDGDVKIGGGEHGAFFLDIKKAGGRVAYLPGANIDELPAKMTDWMHETYPKMRARARQPGRLCLYRRGINEWVCQDGRVERTA